MSRDAICMIGIGGRGTLLTSIVGPDLVQSSGYVMCVDSDPALHEAELPDVACRVVLRAEVSADRDISHARRIYDDSKSRILDELDRLRRSMEEDGAVPAVVALSSSPRGGISNGLTFEMARDVRNAFRGATAPYLTLLAIVPTYNSNFVDVITKNSAVYFRELEQALEKRVFDSAVLLSEPQLRNPAYPGNQAEYRERARSTINAYLQGLVACTPEERERLSPGICTLGSCRLDSDSREPQDIETRHTPLFDRYWPYARMTGVLKSVDADDSEAALATDTLVVKTPAVESGECVAVLTGLDKHPEVRRFLEVTEVSTMTCWKLGGGQPCPKEIAYSSRNMFVAMSYKPEMNDIYKYGIKRAGDACGYKPQRADEEVSNVDIMCKVCQMMQEADCAVVDITHWSPSVMMELGLVYGRGKTTVLLRKRSEAVPTDLKGMEMIEYDSSEDVYEKLSNFLQQHKT